MLTVTWSEFFEPHSAMGKYVITAGVWPDCTGLGSWEVKPEQRHFSAMDLALEQGEKYCMQVIGHNTAGLAGSMRTDGVVIDRTPAACLGVRDGKRLGQDTGYWGDPFQLMANWSLLTPVSVCVCVVCG